MDIIVGSGNNRRKFTTISGNFPKKSDRRVAVEKAAEDLKNFLSARDPEFRKRTRMSKFKLGKAA